MKLLNNNYKIIYILVFMLVNAMGFSLQAQGIKSDIRKGNRLFKKNKFTEAEIRYRKVLQNNENNTHALMGLSDALYKQDKQKESVSYLEKLSTTENLKPEERAQVFHNLGNVYMKEKDYDKSVEAYKMSMRLNPTDEETRYNLILAQKLRQQNKQNGGGGNSNQDQQDKQDKNQQDKKNQQSQEQPQNQQHQDRKQDEQKQQKEQQGEMTKQQAEQILDAYKQDEAQTREKVEREKQKKQRAVNAKIRKKW